MRRNPGHCSWRRSHAFRLPNEYYPEGQCVHVVIHCAEGSAPWVPELAGRLSDLLFADSEVLAACVMPDHVHGLWVVREKLASQVGAFKSLATRAAWQHGHQGKLWQRSFWDQVIWNSKQLATVAQYIVENPVRAGLVAKAEEWPFSFVRIET